MLYSVTGEQGGWEYPFSDWGERSKLAAIEKAIEIHKIGYYDRIVVRARASENSKMETLFTLESDS